MAENMSSPVCFNHSVPCLGSAVKPYVQHLFPGREFRTEIVGQQALAFITKVCSNDNLNLFHPTYPRPS